MIVPLKGVEKNHSLQGTIVHRTAVLLVKKQKKVMEYYKWAIKEQDKKKAQQRRFYSFAKLI